MNFLIGKKFEVEFEFLGKEIRQNAEVIAVNGDKVTVAVEEFGEDEFTVEGPWLYNDWQSLFVVE